MRRRSVLTTAAAVAAASFLPSPTLAEEAWIMGAGAGLPTPAYARWARLAHAASGLRVSYQQLGSGTGADQVIAREVDFASTERPERAETLREQRLIQFPSVLGAVVPIVNLPGVQADRLRLTGEALADLFLGKIARWDDERLAEQNPGLRLPSLPVTAVHRAGASRTTSMFTTYLARASDAWRDGPGASNPVQWPAGQSAEGNGGVASTVRATPGAIGYTDAPFAKAKRLATVALKNRAGAFVTPEPASFAKAAEAGDWSVAGFAADLVDLDAAGAWPIVSPIFILLPSNPTADKVAASQNTMTFFDWAFRNAGEATAQLGFIPLPTALHAPIQEVWRRVTGPDGRPIWEA